MQGRSNLFLFQHDCFRGQYKQSATCCLCMHDPVKKKESQGCTILVKHVPCILFLSSSSSFFSITFGQGKVRERNISDIWQATEERNNEELVEYYWGQIIRCVFDKRNDVSYKWLLRMEISCVYASQLRHLQNLTTEKPQMSMCARNRT